MYCVIVPRCVEEIGRSDGRTWTAVCQSELHPTSPLASLHPLTPELPDCNLVPPVEFGSSWT